MFTTHNSTASICTQELGPMANFSYIIADKSTALATVIDPAWEVPKIIAVLTKHGLKLDSVLLTHSHYDHINGLDELFMHVAHVPLYLSAKEADFWQVIYPNARHLTDKSQIQLGNTTITMLETPGHTPGSVCYSVDNLLFTGDTLFLAGCGRCDLRGGDAGLLFESLHKLKSDLAGDTVIYPGHNYYHQANTAWEFQLRTNPFLQFNHKGEFIKYRLDGK
jgi:hydroxyacylglutathione hydrolase